MTLVCYGFKQLRFTDNLPYTNYIVPVSIFSNFLQYQHPLIKTHLFKHKKIATYIGWVVLKLNSRQNNIIQDLINGCLWQPKNDVNLIRSSCDKFQKFGAMVHLCGKIKTSEQKPLF